MTKAALAGVVLAALLGAGCFVEVEKVKNPQAAFAQARSEASRVHGQPGRPARVELLAYDRDDGELVRASLPMWLVRKIADEDDIDLDLDGEGLETARRVKLRLGLADLERAGRGVLMEVEDEDGDQVLIWLR